MAPAIGSFQVSLAKTVELPTEDFTSSGVSGVPSGPGSTMMPVIVVPETEELLTVVNVSSSVLPGVPPPVASSVAPSAAALMSWPMTFTVTADDPGQVPVGRSHAPVPSVNGTTVPGSTAPVESVA